MRYTITLCTAFCCLTHSMAETINVCNDKFGIIECKKGTQTDLNAHGSAHLDHTRIEGTSSIHGYLHATHAHLDKLKVHGTALLDHCLVNQTTNVFGYLSAAGTQFKQPITLHGNTSNFNHSLINSLNIITPTKQTPQVWLKDHSEIAGNINFRHKKGIVFLDKTSLIHGKIIGGTKKII